MINLIELFMIGITMAFGPCLFFCTPIVLSYIAGTQDSGRKGFKSVLIFSLSRAFIYVLLGLLAGFFGKMLTTTLDKYSLTIYFIGGIFISLSGILILLGKNPNLHLCQILRKYTVEDDIRNTIILGIIIGLLPCTPLLGILVYISLVSKDLWQGALLGLSFGVGTMISPLIIFGILVSTLPKIIMKNSKTFEIFKKACGFLLFLFGVQLIASQII
ncbi:Thiol:disulfide interchange protein DsbD [subsurface metagenome]